MKHKTSTKALSWLLSLAMLFSVVLGISPTAYAYTETLLTTITATGKEQASYNPENVATVSFSYTAGGSSAYLANWGWWGYGWSATVTAAEGYTITKCVFYDDANRTATDSSSPFVVETTEEDKTPQVNGTPILELTSKGIKKIEVYGYATPAHTHNFTYSASGATITATCGSHDNCPLASSDYKATLTIAAPTTGNDATITVSPEGALTGYTVKYQTKSDGTWSSEADAAPTAAGIHKAIVSLGGQTASVSYGNNCITYATGLTHGSISGDIGATCGATVTPTITPDTGYELDTLTVTPEAGSGVSASEITVNGGTFVMPEANVNVSATFKKINSAITLTQPAQGGTVTAKKNDADVTAADYGDTIALGNAPAAGYNFGSYSVTKTGESSTTVTVSNDTFTMPEYPVTVTGTFTPIDYTVTVSATTNGTVQASKTSDAHIGDEITLTVTPSAGYQLDTLTVVKDADNQNVTVSGSKFTMPASDVTVSATFKEITYTVTANGATATVTDSTPEHHTYTAELTGLPSDKTYDGESVTLTATVQKSDGFPVKVTVGTVSFKDQNNNIVTSATEVGTYTASATVGNKTISKSFKINGQANSITYLRCCRRAIQ